MVRADGSDGAGRGRLAERAADAALESAVEKGLVRDAVIASSGEQAKRLWRMREDLPDAQKAAGGSIAHDVSVPLSRLAEFIATRGRGHRGGLSGRPPVLLRAPGRRQSALQSAMPGRWTYERLRPRRRSINGIVHDIVASRGRIDQRRARHRPPAAGRKSALQRSDRDGSDGAYETRTRSSQHHESRTRRPALKNGPPRRAWTAQSRLPPMAAMPAVPAMMPVRPWPHQ